MPRVPRHVMAVLLAAVALAGCGISDTGARPAGEPVRGGLTAKSGSLLRVYFVTRQGTWPVSRPAPDGARLRQAMDALLDGPTADERARGLVTQVPASAEPLRAEAGDGRVELHLPWLVRDLRPVAVSQLVCTAAAAPGVGDDPVIAIHEPGMNGRPWLVKCDQSGAAIPVERDPATPAGRDSGTPAQGGAAGGGSAIPARHGPGAGAGQGGLS